jgi:hypothetical protein
MSRAGKIVIPCRRRHRSCRKVNPACRRGAQGRETAGGGTGKNRQLEASMHDLMDNNFFENLTTTSSLGSPGTEKHMFKFQCIMHFVGNPSCTSALTKKKRGRPSSDSLSLSRSNALHSPFEFSFHERLSQSPVNT